MNWIHLRRFPWLDTRARFVAGTPKGGALLDLGSENGDTLKHFAELRPDLRWFAADLAGYPERYPPGCGFHRCDLEKDRLPWPDRSMDAITCMHLVEHLHSLAHLMREISRLLKPSGRVYFETPQVWTVALPSLRGAAAGRFTFNFYDDAGHLRPVAIDTLERAAREVGLETAVSGTSRNWLFAAAYPWFLLCRASRKKFTAKVHWLGWSAYLVAQRPLSAQ